jgi:predicted metal-binding protein
MDGSDIQTWCERALELGADAAVPLSPRQVVVAEWVRAKCLFGCDEPGVHRTCPPHLPEVDFTRRVLAAYGRGILLRVGPISGSEKSDAESRRLNDVALALEGELFLAGFHKAWTMGAGPCDICGACTRGEECPTPEKARPSLEGCGVDVFATVRNAGWQIDTVKSRTDTYQFFAYVLVD